MVVVVYDPIMGASVIVVSLPLAVQPLVLERGREGLGFECVPAQPATLSVPQWTAGCWPLDTTWRSALTAAPGRWTVVHPNRPGASRGSL